MDELQLINIIVIAEQVFNFDEKVVSDVFIYGASVLKVEFIFDFIR